MNTTIPARPDRERPTGPLVVTAATDRASSIIGRGRLVGPLPTYGSAEWAALPLNSPQAIAATVVAAECWRAAGTPAMIRRTVELELLANRQLENAERSAAFAELAATVRHLSMVPTQDELAHRRQVAA
ncbi:MAG TPA: hypothetical protein VF317_06360 [Dermatophilaceae bacterium]